MTPLLFFGLFILLAIVMLLGYYITAKIQEKTIKQYKDYERKYKLIEFRIRYDPQTAENYTAIERTLNYLGKLPYKNKEKTQTLTTTFWREWSKETQCRVNDHLIEVRDDKYLMS
jgi:hypothetical protein